MTFGYREDQLGVLFGVEHATAQDTKPIGTEMMCVCVCGKARKRGKEAESETERESKGECVFACACGHVFAYLLFMNVILDSSDACSYA